MVSPSDQPIPLAALDSCAAIVGRTGSGKTTAARGAVEELLEDRRQVVVIDPTGAWWGLRLLADGGAEGFPVVIMGGDHGDAPLPPDLGSVVADLIVQRRISAVLDTSLMTMGERRRFYSALLQGLYQGNRAPLHLVVDEADELAPQRPLPDQTLVLHHMEQIVRRGRVRGFRPILITQRPAVLNKNVLSQAGLLIAMQLTAAQDRAAIGAWIEGQADKAEAKGMLAELPKLHRGEGFVWWPAEGGPRRATFPLARSYDSGRAPAAGEAAPAVPAGTDFGWLREALAAAQPPELKHGSKADAAAMQVARAELEQAQGKIAQLQDQLAAIHLAISTEATRHSRALTEALAGLAMGSLRPAEHGPMAAAAHAQAFVAPRLARPPTMAPTAPGDSTLNSAARKMLAVLDTNPPVRRSWTQVATLAGLKARGGHFNAGRKAMLDAGLIIVEGDLVRISEPSAGAAAAQSDPAALVEIWAGSLSGAAPKILRALFQQGGRAGRAWIATHLGMQPRGGHWNAAWKELRDNNIVTISSGDLAELTELFQETAHG